MPEPSVDRLLSVCQAIEIIDATPLSPRTERIALPDALHRRIAVDILADRDDPPFDKSLMDGFAVRTADRSPLRVIGEIAAGASTARALNAGETFAIMTGAPIPPGTDAVIPIEQTRREGDLVYFDNPPKPGQSIYRRAGDCAAGSTVLARGTILGPAQIAVAASMGAAAVEVFAQPTVSILGTGDEIVPADQTPAPWQIRNSNSPMLRALLTQLGCNVRDLGIVRDDPQLIRRQIRLGFETDALFITGGMSMGEHDYVPKLLVEMGVDLKIRKLRIKPGKPFIFGVAPHMHAGLQSPRYIFGLPGNPVSGFVCTLRLAARLLRRLAGGEAAGDMLQASLVGPLPANGPREFYQPALLAADGTVEPLNWKGSADIYTLAKANALIIRPESQPALGTGARVDVIRLPGSSLL